MTGTEYADGVVLMDNGKIIEIGLDIPIPQGTQIIDAQGRLVLPGFVDAHSHIGMWEECIGFEGADGNELTDPVTPQLRAIDGIFPLDPPFQQACQAGVTSVVTGPGSTYVIGGQFLAMITAGGCVVDMARRGWLLLPVWGLPAS